MMDFTNLTKKRIQEFLAEGKRFDGRHLHDFREISIETGISKNAEGSARVKLGNTEVVAGVKVDVSEPYTDGEEEGTLVTTVELLPLSSPKYEPGPPKIEAIEMARIIDRGIRESGFIQFKDLCIKKGEKVYTLYLDIYSINDDGNLIDACGLAAVSALLSAKMPKYDAETESIKFGEFTKTSVPVSKKIPIAMTFYKIKDKIILDPTASEEDASTARLSIAMTGDKEVLINAMQKGGNDIFTEKELSEMIDIAEKKFMDIEKKVKKEIEKA